ncbi:hypothetical protein K440DRAFT_616948 [Wilcoxina mikolae CBS 423.85]|nr:hypothetical protein K440DRAFT_616948 [Wilcoxina mikolae CBS 423.85]
MASARVLPSPLEVEFPRAPDPPRAYEGVRAWIVSSSLHVRVCSPGGLQIKRGMM